MLNLFHFLSSAELSCRGSVKGNIVVNSLPVYLPLYNKSIAKYFDELKFYDSFEELTLTFRKYKSLPRRVFARCLIPCSSANKVIRNFVRTFPDYKWDFVFSKKNIILTLIFSCSREMFALVPIAFPDPRP